MAAVYAVDDQQKEYGEDYRYDDDEAIDPRYAQMTDDGERIQSVHSNIVEDPTPQADITTVDKKEQKRLEKENRDREKREKEELKRKLKEQEKQIKEEAKKLKSATPGRKKEREGKPATVKKTTNSPGATPKNAISCRVRLLDGTEYQFEIERSAKGSLLVEMVCEHVNLLEREYFSCYYENNGIRFWLLLDRRVQKQIGRLPWVFDFGVKFYPPEPNQLQEDITRYYLCLQIRGDILSGKLQCTNVTNALLGSYVVQSELGDYDPAEFGTGIDYLRDFNFCPNQTDELLTKIAQLHKTLRDQTPAEAELNYLINATKLELYGIELQPAKDAEMVNISVGVSYSGLFVYRDNVRINRFPWPVILKMSYKKRIFYVKIRPAEGDMFIMTLAFMMPSHKLAKRFWRLAIQHHSFFRLKAPLTLKRNLFERFGSSKHRFSGRTYFQSHTWAASVSRPPPYFERFGSRQNTSRSLGSGAAKLRSFDETEEQKWRQYHTDEGEVAVVAGTAPAASRVAYVKTVQPGDTSGASAGGRGMSREEVQSPRDTSFTAGYRPKVSFDDSNEWNDSQDVSASAAAASGPPIPAKKKKKKTVTMTTTKYSYNDEEGGNVVTEYKTETNGVVETKIERRAVIGRQDIDHDLELSKAINSVMDMNADLSVDKIEINPTDVAHSMVSSSGTQQTIEIKTKKTKKSKKHEVIAE